MLRKGVFFFLTIPLWLLTACAPNGTTPTAAATDPALGEDVAINADARQWEEEDLDAAPQLAALGNPAVKRQRISCVPYARQLSGIQLKGDAWRWWDAAKGVYLRGQAPKVGAVVVMAKRKSMPKGHVAVVTTLVNKRLLRIDHANWTKGEIHRGSYMIDVSPTNDWSQVRVWYPSIGDFGSSVYKVSGFIYPQLVGS